MHSPGAAAHAHDVPAGVEGGASAGRRPPAAQHTTASAAHGEQDSFAAGAGGARAPSCPDDAPLSAAAADAVAAGKDGGAAQPAEPHAHGVLRAAPQPEGVQHENNLRPAVRAVAAGASELGGGTDVAAARDDSADDSSELHCSYERTGGDDAGDHGPVDSSDDERRRPGRWDCARSSADEADDDDDIRYDGFWEADEVELWEQDMAQHRREACEADGGYDDYDGS
jgi:hypothetical protein